MSLLLSDGQIASMRLIAERALPDTAVIQRCATSSDSGGGQTTSWSDLATVACRLSPVAGGEGGTSGDRIVDEATQVVTVPALTDVTETDRLVIDGTVYEIQLVRMRGEWALTKRCECREAV